MARPGRLELPTLCLEVTEPRCAAQAGKERTTCKCTPVNGLEATSWSDALLLGNLFLRSYAVQNSKCRCWCLRGSASFISPLKWTEVGLKCSRELKNAISVCRRFGQMTGYSSGIGLGKSCRLALNPHIRCAKVGAEICVDAPWGERRSPNDTCAASGSSAHLR